MARSAILGWSLVALGLAVALLQYFGGVNEDLQDLSRDAFGEDASVAFGTVFGRAAVYLTGFFIAVAGLGVLAARKPEED